MSASPYTQMSGGYPDQFGQSGRPNAQGLNWAQQDNAQHLRQGAQTPQLSSLACLGHEAVFPCQFRVVIRGASARTPLCPRISIARDDHGLSAHCIRTRISCSRCAAVAEGNDESLRGPCTFGGLRLPVIRCAFAGPGGWMGPTASPGDYNLSPSMAQRAANNRWLAREQEVSNSVSRRTPSITLPPSPSGGSTGWWNASPTASAPRQGIQQFSSPTSVSQLSGRGLGLASPTQFSRSSYGTMQQRQPGLQIDTQSQGWVPSPQRSPLRLPSGSTLPLPFNVYDMKR